MPSSKPRAAFALFLALASAGHAAPYPAAPADIQQLERSEHFLRGLVGFAGQLSASDLLFERLLQASDAESVFLQVAGSTRATAAAKAYAACGLSRLGGRHLAGIVQALGRDRSVVSTMHGDQMSARPLSLVVQQISEAGC